MTYTRKHPFLSRLKERYKLTKAGSLKETQHVVLDLAGSDIDYTVGDSFAIFAKHHTELVDKTLAALKVDGAQEVEDARQQDRVTLRELFTSRRNITQLQKKALKVISQTRQELTELLEPDNVEALRNFLATHELWDAVGDAPPPIEELVAALPPLLPRFYSIASSQGSVGNEVHLTVALVEEERGGHTRYGVATRYLCRDLELENEPVPLYLQPAPKFRLPEDPGIPVVMVGPGTGVAPFRAFMQERAQQDTRNWLFFGDWRRATDFLYEDEMLSWEADQKLRLSLAFSRDQDHKIYVQDRMREQAAELWRWLEEGAWFYVCGDAKRMAPAVEATLQEIAREHGALDEEQAKLYTKELRQAGRYHKDVY